MKTLFLSAALLWPTASEERIVFLGDSITDGNTYPLLVAQALREAGLSPPILINAGVAGDTASGLRRRLDRDVGPYRPTRATLLIGINDAFHQVRPDSYEADVLAISDYLKARGIPLVLLNFTVLGPKHSKVEGTLARYAEILRDLAKREGYPIAEVRPRMLEAQAAGQGLLEEDQVHLSFAGYRALTRALLDVLGHARVPVPAEQKLEPMPGIIREWKIRPLPDGEWSPLVLPQPGALKAWWVDQERRRGFAVELGPQKRFQAVATVQADRAREVYLNTGASLESITLNGRRLWTGEGWTGWHAGKERLPARLEAGANELVLECGPSFFLSLTEGKDW